MLPTDRQKQLNGDINTTRQR